MVRSRTLAGLAVATLLVLALVPVMPVGSQTVPSITLAPEQGEPGTVFTVRGTGFALRLGLQLWWGAVGSGELLAEIESLESESFSLDVAVPSTAEEGLHRVLACQPDPGFPSDCLVQAGAVFQVTPRPTTTVAPTTTLPIGSSTTTSSTSTTLPLASSTTTSPTTTSTLPLASSTTTSLAGSDDIGTPPTTVGGFPPPPSTIGPGTFGVSTTTTQPPLVAPSGIANLAVTDLEVTQGLQDLQNRFPLVAMRRTIVRVHGISETENPNGQAGVRAAVEGIRLDGGGENLGMVFSENSAVFADTRRRESHDRSPYVILPESWAQGTVRLRVWVWSGDPTAGNEPSAEDNLMEVTVDFHPTETVHLWYWPLYMTEDFDPDGDPVIYFPADGWLSEHLGVYRVWPVTGLVPHPMNVVVGDADSNFDLSEDGNSAAPNAVLDELWLINEPGENHLYSGMVHSSLKPPARFSGFASGIGVSTWSIMGYGYSGSYPWFEASGHVIAHEGGHAFGLQHAPCQYTVGDPIPGEVSGGAIDPSFPGSYGWPACTLAPQDTEGFYGLDVYWEWSPAGEPTILSNHLSAEAPNAAYPWMGYRKPGWLDPWHGCFLIDALGVPCTQTDLVFIDTDSPTGGGIPTPAPQPQSRFDCSDFSFDGVDMCQFAPTEPFDPTASQEDVVVTGLVNPTSGEAEILRVLTVPDHSPTRNRVWGDPHIRENEKTTWVLAALDEFGVARWVEPIPTEAAGHIGDEDGDHGFAMRIPKVDGVVEYGVFSTDGLAAAIVPSASPPSVTATAEIADDGILLVDLDTVDPDGDRVWTLARYRPDSDSPWSPVSAAASAGSLQVDTGHLPGSAGGQLQLLSSDGFHTVTTDLVLVVPQQVPKVLVLSPVNGAERPAGRPIDLRAQVEDPEDGPITDVVWTSDVDGELGTGSLLTVFDLSQGTHSLTATATDSSGTTGSSTVQITILPSDLPDDETITAIEAVFRDGPQEPGSATQAAPDSPPAVPGPAGGLPWIPLLVGGIAGAGAIVLGRLWSGRRSRPKQPSG